MNKEAQRIAIAEACGWKRIGTEKNLPLYGWIEIGPMEEIPDYLNDLNAIHEAEKVLTTEQHSIYGRHLLDLTKDWRPYWGTTRVAYATAAQKAQALLRTLNLWTPSP